jgi:tryptophan synthase alpha chain
MANGLERIAAVFAAARSEGRAALMPYMMAGFRDAEWAAEVSRAYAEAGADLVEVGVPFSDPLADGPVIHAAATEALKAGANLESGFEVSRRIGQGIPAILMTYVNMILAEGAERFAGRAAEAGVAGVIVPDLPFGEAPEIEHALGSAGIASIQLIAPTTTKDRRAEICEAAEGFIYLVSSVGTTGVRQELPSDLAELVDDVKQRTETPVAVGFGIGNRGRLFAVGEIADGVIIGSQLVRLAGAADSPAEAGRACAEFLADVREGLVEGA